MNSGKCDTKPDAPVVTVGLPVYNGERFLDEAIMSIRAQTLADFELVIADNASTDGTLEICRRHAADDPRIRVLTSDENRGAAWNFNRLVQPSGGRYFKWAAHDDTIAPEFLERCVAVLDAEPEVVLSYSKAVDIDEKGEQIGPVASEQYAIADDPVERVRSLLELKSSCVETFGVMRREFLVATGLIGAYTSSDRTLLFELALRGRFCELPDPHVRRRQHSGRSVRVTARERNAWFDPSRSSVLTFPRWRLVRELFRATDRAALDRSQRWRVRGLVTRWAVRQSKVLVREVAAWGRHGLSSRVHRAVDAAHSRKSAEVR